MTLGADSAEGVAPPRALLQGFVLLLLAERPGHGYDLTERVARFSHAWARTPNAIYRDLRRLEAQGLIVSVLEASQIRGPARRIYQLTPAGRASLEAWVEEIRDAVDTLARCMSRHAAFAAGARPSKRRRIS